MQSSVAKTSHAAPLNRLATNAGAIPGLADRAHGRSRLILGTVYIAQSGLYQRGEMMLSIGVLDPYGVGITFASNRGYQHIE